MPWDKQRMTSQGHDDGDMKEFEGDETDGARRSRDDTTETPGKRKKAKNLCQFPRVLHAATKKRTFPHKKR